MLRWVGFPQCCNPVRFSLLPSILGSTAIISTQTLSCLFLSFCVHALYHMKHFLKYLKIFSKAAMPSFCCPDCGTEIQGTNCAHSLSRQMVTTNFFVMILGLDGCILYYKGDNEIQGWRNISGCYAACPCGYPVRAKEVRANLFTEVKSFSSLCFGLICILVPVVETFLFYSG